MKNPAVLQAFAHRFHRLRKTQGYSQQQLAGITHAEQFTSKRLKLRQFVPTLGLLLSLNQALDPEARDLVDDPVITHSNLQVPVSEGAELLLP